MKKNINFRNFYVKPKLPENLESLNILAENLWSTWNPNAYKLFSRIDPILFRKFNHNPVRLIQKVPTEKLVKLSQESGFLNELDSVYKQFISYKDHKGYYLEDGKRKKFDNDFQIAYFSMEFGLHESLPIYSGGLGILSGDHLKAASDMGLPLIGFGLLYRYGYFNQKIDLNGKQAEVYNENEWHSKPIKKVIDKNGEDLVIKIKIRDEIIFLKAWEIQVGKISLYLLDANIGKNKLHHRKITDYLYVSDREMRILQEIVLAFGSLKLIEKLKIKPTVYHLNEGHSAFLIIKRLNDLMNSNDFSFDEAREVIRLSTVFTTHTPVPAGNEAFEMELVRHYFSDEIKETKMSFEQFTNLAKINNNNDFSLSVLAIKFAKYINGVSKLHSIVSKEMWNPIYSNICEDEMPIDSITNGVHIPTWLSRQMSTLFDRYIGSNYEHNADEETIWKNILNIPDIEIWEAHQQRKQQMITFIRERLRSSLMYKSSEFATSEKIKNVLSPDKLIIGFARRFATYKRANLILMDKKRLLKLICDPKKPVQFVFAGKAHPADEFGKSMIKEIIDFAKENQVEDSFVFIEDYDMNVARHIVQGVDVWLNTPIKPKEASGTSGMKAGINGVMNFSILDGWWPECYSPDNGWSIIAGSQQADQQIRDAMDANEIYDILESEIAPTYYKRNKNRIPSRWIKMMKHSIHDVGKGFNVHSMLREYLNKFYLHISKDVKNISDDNYKYLKHLNDIESKLQNNWQKVKFVNMDINIQDSETINSGDVIKINAKIYIDGLDEKLLKVELFNKNEENEFNIYELSFAMKEKNIATFEGEFTIKSSGKQSYNIRIRPNQTDLVEYYEYVKWYY
ncbi:MAG: alpha-glucan family phosphorylase [Candidatus Cloacimonadota bacterium]|nr:alpha-glucan family phosphorylase [Candidatus Cloacimonadota bacterium]